MQSQHPTRNNSIAVTLLVLAVSWPSAANAQNPYAQLLAELPAEQAVTPVAYQPQLADQPPASAYPETGYRATPYTDTASGAAAYVAMGQATPPPAPPAAAPTLFAPPAAPWASETIPTAPPVELVPVAGPSDPEAPAEASVTVSVVETPVVSEAAEPADETPESTAIAEPAQEVQWYSPTYWFGPTPWDSGYEIGLNGSSGTSESLSIRTGGYVKRKGDDYKLNSSLYYNKTTSNGVETQSNALLDMRYDWMFSDASPWSIFAMSQTFYDEFQTFDLNFNLNTGLGYQLLDEDWVELSTRIGAGASREVGGLDNAWVPEANFGFDYNQKLTETEKFYAKVDYFPELEDFGAYRVISDIGMEIELTVPSNVSLKISATDRYDSEPDGVHPHNLNYSVLLLWKL
ncbi:hypothetical protein Mal64_24140 [Pseudobythopirellula maris]|uniref:Uncharacterized protein n=1 Tax=Pseudobythopirellula maris TaxID=2527991 RepID=A0A5C5ZN45_9BACT|nr:DUF481 domain-containing protein [Pseudobythopirellula maris]TWT88924.1 hypothetical protein Mal64_24140 [Pseudobythopirellula maris]